MMLLTIFTKFNDNDAGRNDACTSALCLDFFNVYIWAIYHQTTMIATACLAEANKETH